MRLKDLESLTLVDGFYNMTNENQALSPEALTHLKSLQDLDQLLKDHDWYYEYTDDLRVFNKGHGQRVTIYRKVAKNGAQGLLRYNLECPDSMKLDSIDSIPKGMR
jgi:hypothetical protein